MAEWSHNTYEWARRKTESEGKELNRLSEERAFKLSRGVDGVSVNPRPSASPFCKVVDCVVWIGIGVILGMTIIFYFQ
jgi:hypothetical protein